MLVRELFIFLNRSLAIYNGVEYQLGVCNCAIILDDSVMIYTEAFISHIICFRSFSCSEMMCRALCQYFFVIGSSSLFAFSLNRLLALVINTYIVFE